MKANVIFLFFLLCVVKSFPQEVSGIIVDSKTNTPIEGASVYFDNTTVGTISDMEGLFNITKSASINSPLVVSFLGYKKQVISNYSTEEKLTIFLVEDINALNEVFLESKDSWSRARKLKDFKTYFLGETNNALSCKILNEEVIRLQFLETENKLVASATTPLVILNENLKYQIQYDLQDFEVTYQMGDNLQDFYPSSVFYAGTSFYMSGAVNKRIIKRRNKVYNGSVLHFMRVLLLGKLADNKFKLIFEGKEVPQKNFISIYATDNPELYQVRLFKPLLVVYDNDTHNQSRITSKDTYFYLDKNGNHSPVDGLIFTGYFGKQRIADTLPLDYQPEKD
ncbi:CarboxypepD_reg-like domain-containing protein [Bizionia echini]|uniref:CarboxypepD_reg-like domain-containing protein n=1 Tax=Bizionia echini TaxID=649333 RepID=A0A1I4ZM08_9FLAO|nr:carboxypeptidase-like regulatory domain-containing protein [Bizionia echini]SFN51311.1 CarboxypepD_reg-like domain-containing protein [Bizionia echini]